jgi:hypothetical protein
MEEVVLINLAIYSLMVRWLEGHHGARVRPKRIMRTRDDGPVPDPHARAASEVGLTRVIR